MPSANDAGQHVSTAAARPGQQHSVRQISCATMLCPRSAQRPKKCRQVARRQGAKPLAPGWKKRWAGARTLSAQQEVRCVLSTWDETSSGPREMDASILQGMTGQLGQKTKREPAQS